MSNLSEIERAQNESKRAICYSAADEIIDLIVRMRNYSSKLDDITARISYVWSGSAFDQFRASTDSASTEFVRISSRMKGIADSVKAAANEAYPS
jgi:uncharacterized protein YukE